jgi:uncharacterized metal-binding protein
MASGTIHTRISLTAAAPVGVLAFWQTCDPVLALAAAAGCASGIYLSPDLDICGTTKSEILARRHFGLVLGWLFWAFWYPYGRMIRHRSFWSHAPIIGTAGRVLYIVVPCILALFALEYSGILALDAAAICQNIGGSLAFWYILRGLAVSDVLHFLADYW